MVWRLSARKIYSLDLKVPDHLFDRFYDVPSFFGRDISRFRNFADLWYGNSPKLVKLLSSQKVSIWRHVWPRRLIKCDLDY